MNCVVVGGNVIGMIAALRLKDKFPSASVALVEPGVAVGANMQTVEFEGHIFDQGMQNWYDTGIHWVDDYVRMALNEANFPYTAQLWPFHDNSGIVFDEKLQCNSPYIDASNFSTASIVRERILTNVVNYDQAGEVSLGDYLENRFGLTETDPKINSLLKKYEPSVGQPQAACFAKMLPLDRVLIDSITEDDLNQNPELRNYVATAHKQDVPSGKNSGKFTVYPTSGGISKLVDAFKMLLEKKGIGIYTSCNVHFDSDSNMIELRDKDLNLISFDKLVWGLNLNWFKDCAELTKPAVELASGKLDTSVVHVVTDQVVSNRNLIYLFDLCKTPFNRVTFYGELTKKEEDYRRMTFELIRTPDNYKSVIENFLIKYGFITKGKIVCSSPKRLPWPPYFPIGYEGVQSRLAEFAMSIKNVDSLISSDASKSSVLMFPTAGRVFKDEFWD